MMMLTSSSIFIVLLFFFFFFNDTATTEIYTLSLHDALPIGDNSEPAGWRYYTKSCYLADIGPDAAAALVAARSEEHTSELQSHVNLVCRLLLEKKKKKQIHKPTVYTKKTY